MKSNQAIAFILAAVWVLAGCSPASRPTNTAPSVQQLASTIAAATIQAQQAATSTPIAIPTIPSIVPTAKPTLFIHAAESACRSGPGADFKIIATFTAGASVEMVGKDTSDGYWIVLDPASQTPCWVQAQDGTPAGSFDILPEMTPQASTQKLPAKPVGLTWPFYCSYNSDGSYALTIQLTWMDTSNDENGFRIFRSGAQIADLPPNTMIYKETISVPADTVIIYGVEAYNDAGVSPQALTPGGPKSGSRPVSCSPPPTAKPTAKP